MNEHLNHHMTPVPPHSLPYTIRVDSDFQSNPQPTIYDIPIPDPLPSLTTPPPSLSRIALHSLVHSSTAKLTTGAIAQRDALQAETVSALQASRARFEFFNTLSRDPVSFVRRWIASQQRDLEVILGDARFGNPDQDVPDHERWMADEFRQGGDKGVWGSEGVRESVGLMVRGQRS
jgi:SWI/SNF-related matrix-associated actin-dependent regulator of chromatin subfamily D